jgi:transposase-like protein
MGASQRSALPTARLLYARGRPISEIAARLGVHDGTIYRWRAADEKRGLSWAVLRDKTPATGGLTVGLEALIASLLDGGSGEPVERAQAVASLHHVLTVERAFEGELHGIGRFAAWCRGALPAADHAVIVGAIGRYLAEVRGILAAEGGHD